MTDGCHIPKSVSHGPSTNSSTPIPPSSRPTLSDVGIIRLAVYIPRNAISQQELEKYDGVSIGKYTIGLGQSHMTFVTDCEDVVSLAMTALSSLVRNAGISYSDIGRLDVGTETIIDKSRERASRADGRPFTISDSTDYCVFHAPFNKMVRKSLACLLHCDFVQAEPDSDPFFHDVERFRSINPATAYRDREAVRAFVNLSADLFDMKCAPAAWLSMQIGNCYTASLYSSLAALIDEASDNLIGKRVLMYAFGSGFAASMFSIRVTASVRDVLTGPPIRERLTERIFLSPTQYYMHIREREKNYGRLGYVPETETSSLYPGTFYLKEVLGDGERKYSHVPYR